MLLLESRFTTIEDDISVPEITNEIKKWIKAFRKEHSLIPGETRKNAIELIKQKVKTERCLYLGTMKIGRKRVNIWVTDLNENDDGHWVEAPKKASYILTSLNTIINNPARTLSVIVHELIHSNQQYRKNSEKYTTAVEKTSDETEEELFDYYTEPKEIEAQLGQLAHDIVVAFRQKRNKTEVIKVLEDVLKLPREKFVDTSWMTNSNVSKYTWSIFANHFNLLKSISAPPESQANSLRYKQISDKCWRQFKQKLFNLVQTFKEQISEQFTADRLNNGMSKFDLVFEKVLAKLNEREYINSTFGDNVRLLVKALKDNDYINPSKDIEHVVKHIMDQPNNVKELNLDTQEQSLPPMKLKLKQESDSESFAVTVINLKDPAKQKDFSNSMLETIFDEVLSYIKTAALEGIQPEAAVDTLPPAEGGNAQPGAEGSALPQGEEQPAV